MNADRDIDHHALIAAMQSIVGTNACLTHVDEIAPFVVDYKGVYQGSTPIVVRPKTTSEVSRVVQYCAQNGVGIVPQGGNTSMVGGSVPDETSRSIVLSLVRMNEVLEIDTVNDTITVQAGCTLAQVRAAAEEAGRLFALRIGSDGTCQIGGNLSTNAGGTAVLKYGNMRELALGMEVVLPSGQTWSRLKGLRKDNTGYDLKQLFIGAEGTLGVITAAVLKLHPLPTARAVAMLKTQNAAAAIELLAVAKAQAGQAVTAFELISPDAMTLVLSHLGLKTGPISGPHSWQVLVELSTNGSQQSVDDSMLAFLEIGAELGLVEDAAIAASQAQMDRMWMIREEISDAQTRAGGSVRCDVSVPISYMARFIAEASGRVLTIAPEARLVIYGHIGDGNVHFNPLRPAEQAAKDFVQSHGDAINEFADGLAIALNGSISAEHGVGVAKRDGLLGCKPAVEIDIMWSIKNALDPAGVMNPGKVLPMRMGQDPGLSIVW